VAKPEEEQEEQEEVPVLIMSAQDTFIWTLTSPVCLLAINAALATKRQSKTTTKSSNEKKKKKKKQVVVNRMKRRNKKSPLTMSSRSMKPTKVAARRIEKEGRKREKGRGDQSGK